MQVLDDDIGEKDTWNPQFDHLKATFVVVLFDVPQAYYRKRALIIKVSAIKCT